MNALLSLCYHVLETDVLQFDFYRATQLCYSAILGVVILSVSLSVCHTRAL